MNNFSVGNFRVSFVSTGPQGEELDIRVSFTYNYEDGGTKIQEFDMTWDDMNDLQHALRKAHGMFLRDKRETL